MRDELQIAVDKLSEIALSSGISLDGRSLDGVDRQMWEEIKHTRASLAIEYVNAWKRCYDSFEAEDC